MRRWLRRAAALLASLLLLLELAIAVGEQRRHTPPFRDAQGAPLPGSVALMERMDLNGSLQSVWIRGADRRLPLLVLLHGGPGASESALFRAYVPELERHYLVVYWEQRGTGRSWLPAGHREALGTGQLLRDLDALVEEVTRRFGQRQVVLLGHSWGTVLGVLYAGWRPERVRHYVGVAQVVHTVEAQKIEREFVLEQALARHDEDVVAELRAMGPPPLRVPELLRQGSLCERYGGVFHGAMRTHDLLRAPLRTEETALLDLALFGLGNGFSLERLWPESIAIDFFRSAPRLQVPVTLMLGRHDRHVPAELSARWFAALEAPAKQLVWFERSAHNPPFEEPDAFVAALAKLASAP
jgi:pimeloyl-ACP methyl ester carboxylesterase